MVDDIFYYYSTSWPCLHIKQPHSVGLETLTELFTTIQLSLMEEDEEERESSIYFLSLFPLTRMTHTHTHKR